ncbi:hypothetical protein F443_22453 [Phytophthora nicotianae P1569]|uniref:Uncharacterized protein n=2 Tax=Phytophthora nicotianae TaxID=4792 RepID=V9DVV9_PHYNI|nr:hypothetical protein F443_22453 [Phytophthora nicotianae P1569]ETO61405.1 hypothetical protein F444_20581 [Phytophthora nicotianae P1976]
MSPGTGSGHIPSISPSLTEANCHFTTSTTPKAQILGTKFIV